MVISNDRRLANQAIKFRNTFGVYPFHHGYMVIDGEWRHHMTGDRLIGGRSHSIFKKIGKAFKSVGHSIENVGKTAVSAVSNVAQSAVGATTDDLVQARGPLSKFGDDFVKGLEIVAGKLGTGGEVLGNWVIKHPKFFAHVIVNVGIAIAFPELAPDLALETGGLLLETVLQDTMGQPQPTQADIDKMIAEAREKMQNDPVYQASIHALGDFVGYISNITQDYGLSVDINEDNGILYIGGTTTFGVSLDHITIDIDTDTYKLTLTNTANNAVFNGGNYTDMITFDGGKPINELDEAYSAQQAKG